MRRVGLPRPKLPLHPNRALAPAAPPPTVNSPAGHAPAAERISSPLLSVTLPLKRVRSRSLPPSPSSPQTPTSNVLAPRSTPASSFILSWQPDSPLSPPCLWTLARASPPPDPSISPLAASLAVTTPMCLVDASVPPLPPVPQISSPILRSSSPRHWTLAEVVKRCTTWEEYQQHRPTGFSALRESWAVVDAAMRKRHYKQPKESWSVVFKRVRSNIQDTIKSKRSNDSMSSGQMRTGAECHLDLHRCRVSNTRRMKGRARGRIYAANESLSVKDAVWPGSRRGGKRTAARSVCDAAGRLRAGARERPIGRAVGR